MPLPIWLVVVRHVIVCARHPCHVDWQQQVADRVADNLHAIAPTGQDTHTRCAPGIGSRRDLSHVNRSTSIHAWEACLGKISTTLQVEVCFNGKPV